MTWMGGLARTMTKSTLLPPHSFVHSAGAKDAVQVAMIKLSHAAIAAAVQGILTERGHDGQVIGPRLELRRVV